MRCTMAFDALAPLEMRRDLATAFTNTIREAYTSHFLLAEDKSKFYSAIDVGLVLSCHLAPCDF